MNLIAQKVGNKAYEKYKSAFRHKDIISKLQAKGERFIDEEFPPKSGSISKTGNIPHDWKSIVFKRATEFIDPTQLRVFRGIDPNDIRQGKLGDCYLLCSLSVLAEREKLVKRLFITEEPNDVGCYALWINDNGAWRSIVVDDYFPCTSNGGPAFTKTNGEEIWVLLIEKAYAKIYGGYDVIEGGVPPFALRDLTGAPYDFLESEDPAEVWKAVKESLSRKYLMTCYTKISEIREEKNPLGIVSGHAYSILDAKEVQTAEGTERILKVRNPWGQFEWKGDWGDNSSKWTPDVIKQVQNFTRADDGTFWISILDFIKFYEGIGICKLHEDYYYRSMNFRHNKPMPQDYFVQEDTNIPYENPNYSIIRLRVEKKTHVFLSLNQMDERKFINRSRNEAPYTFSIARMLLAKVEPFGLRFIDGIFFNDRNIVIEQNLNAGVYVVTIEIMWSQPFYREFNLSAYTQYPVDFEEISKADINHIQRNIIKSMILIDPQSKKKDYGSIKEPEIRKYTGSSYGIAYFYYQNGSNNGKTLNETVTMNQRENLRITPPFTNNMQFEVNVLPQRDALVMYKCLNGEQYVFATKSSFKASVLPQDEMVKYARMAYAETTYLDDTDDAINKSADTDYYDEFIRDDRDNLEVFDYDKVAEDMKNAGFGEIDLDGELHGNTNAKKQGSKLKVGQKTSEMSYLTGGQKFLDPFIKKAEDGTLTIQPIDETLKDKNIYSFEVVGNIPNYVRDDSDHNEFPLYDLEKVYVNFVDSNLPERVKPYIDLGFSALLGTYLLFTVLLSFLRTEYLDLLISILLIALLATKLSAHRSTSYKVNLLLRVLPFAVLAAIFFDIIWLSIYEGDWTEDDVVDRKDTEYGADGVLDGLKDFVIGLTYFSILVKIAFGVILEYKVVKVLSTPLNRPFLY